MEAIFQKKPEWLRVKATGGETCAQVRDLVRDQKLHTVCESARCPNIGECWNQGTATFMILGDVCARNCRFCAVGTGKPNAVDEEEPRRIAEAVRSMNLQYVVITSVTRDDLDDDGASAWADTIRAVRDLNPHTKIEVLIPDFRGKRNCLEKILEARPDVLGHNLETVPRLYSQVRPQAVYERSVELLWRAKEAGFITKTGFMLGIGEREQEIEDVIKNLTTIPVDILTLGQYLRPTQMHCPVDRWVTPEEFSFWKQKGLDCGFKIVESAPLVRSSYHASNSVAMMSNSIRIKPNH
ncbi:MAG: lipoyl synthase [Verrucomicrobiota bacterium]